MKYIIYLQEKGRDLAGVSSEWLSIGYEVEIHGEMLRGDLMLIDLEITARIAYEYPHLPNETLLVVKRTLEISNVNDVQVLIVEKLTVDNFRIKIRKT